MAYDDLEDAFELLKEAFAPLEESKTVKYFGEFECCGSCAWYRIRTEDWGDYKGLVMFNEQTADRARESGEMWLSVGGFDTADNDEITRLVGEALIAAGFTMIEPRDMKHNWDFTPKTFCVAEGGGYKVWGYFKEEEDRYDDDDEDDSEDNPDQSPETD